MKSYLETLTYLKKLIKGFFIIKIYYKAKYKDILAKLNKKKNKKISSSNDSNITQKKIVFGVSRTLKMFWVCGIAFLQLGAISRLHSFSERSLHVVLNIALLLLVCIKYQVRIVMFFSRTICM